MDKKLRNRIIALASAGIISMTSVFSAVHLISKIKDEDLKEEIKKDLKPYSQILKDGESFSADMEISLNKSKFYNLDKCIRLKIDDDKPIIVEYQSDMEEKEVKAIKDVICYYNKVFKSIDENYRFEFKNNDTKITDDHTVVSFVNVNKPKSVYGESIATDDISVGNGEFLVNKAQIQLDWEKLKDKEEAYIYAVALHEFSHALGLGDVYQNKYNMIDRSTVMHTDTWGNINHLFPNDYAVLQALYSNEYKKHDNYEDAVKVVNEKIGKYTEAFYRHYSTYLKENRDATSNLKKEELPSTIEWVNFRENVGKNFYTINIEDDKCELLVKDEMGNCVARSTGSVSFEGGVLFIKGIVIEDASKYSYNYDFLEGKKLKLMLSVYLDKNNNLVIDNGLSKNFLKTNLLKENNEQRGM